MPDYSSVAHSGPQYGVALVLVLVFALAVMAKIYNTKSPSCDNIKPIELPPIQPIPVRVKMAKAPKAIATKPVKLVKPAVAKPKTSPDIIRDAVDALVAVGVKKSASLSIVRSLVNKKEYADAASLIFDAFKVK